MRLLIVVDKLLTGFDAPSATYLYIDKKMRDHGLFQAICRVNRLDGDDKDYGYIIDYQDLFNSLEDAITDYTSGALDGYEKKDIEGLLSDRIEKAREDLDEALERSALCEPVAPPKNTLQYQQYFCAMEQGNAEQLKANEPKRVELYKSVAALVRAYGNLANEMDRSRLQRGRGARRSRSRGRALRRRPRRGEARRRRGRRLQAVRSRHAVPARHLHSGRALRVVSNFEDAGLIDLIVKLGAGAIDKLPAGIKNDPEAVAETITNNMRKVIIDERP
jgi:type I restriction enzyme R subunit